MSVLSGRLIASKSAPLVLLLLSLLMGGIAQATELPQSLPVLPEAINQQTPTRPVWDGKYWDYGYHDCTAASVAMALRTLQMEGKLSSSFHASDQSGGFSSQVNSTDKDEIYDIVRIAFRSSVLHDTQHIVTVPNPNKGITVDLAIQIVPLLTDNAVKVNVNFTSSDNWQSFVTQQLRAGYPIMAAINNWQFLDSYDNPKDQLTVAAHLILITELQGGLVTYNDPWDGKLHHLSSEKFATAWGNSSGWGWATITPNEASIVNGTNTNIVTPPTKQQQIQPTIETAPPPPSVRIPLNGASTPSIPNLCWRNNGGTSTEFSVALSNGGPNNIQSPWSTSTCWQPPSSLNFGEHAWHVLARNRAGQTSDTSPCWSNAVSCYGDPWWTSFIYTPTRQPTPQEKLPPGGVWNTPEDGATVIIGSRPHFQARAYPTNEGGPAVSHVAFTVWWPTLGPENGSWNVACDEYRQRSPDIYACDWSGSGQVSAGPAKISFNVYDVAGGRNLAPNGVRTVYFQSAQPPPTLRPEPPPTEKPAPSPIKAHEAKPGGFWTSPENGAQITGFVHFVARAYPTDRADPAIHHVNFTANIGGWFVACQVPGPAQNDTYECALNPASKGATPGQQIQVSFDVYDQAGNTNFSPNGERTITYVGRPVSRPAAPSNLQATPTDSTRIQLSWRDNSDNELGFRIYDGNIFIVDANPNTTTYTVSGLSPNSYHCIHINAFNSGGSSPWTDFACASTLAQPSKKAGPVKPGGLWISPDNASTITDLVHFAAHAYPTNRGDPPIDHVNFTANPGNWFVACQINGASHDDVYECSWNPSTNGVNSGQRVQISFDVYDQAGNSNAAPNGVHTITYSPPAPPATPPAVPAPNSPTLSSPSNGATLYKGSDITFVWNGVPGATAYYLEYSGGPYGTLNSGWVNSTSYHIGQMWPGNTYTWHVKAGNGSGDSDWSPTWSFTVSNSDPPPDAPGCLGAPSLQSPGDGASFNAGTQVTLRWEPPKDCSPDGYTFRITSGSNPNDQPWIVDTGWAPTSYIYSFNNNGTYYWSVRACKPCTPYNPGAWATRRIVISNAPPPQDPGGGIQLCDGANYGGQCKTFTAGKYLNLQDQGWYDRTVSVRFLGGYIGNYHVVLNSETNFTGDPYHADKDVPELDNAHRKHIRSLEIYHH